MDRSVPFTSWCGLQRAGRVAIAVLLILISALSPHQMGRASATASFSVSGVTISGSNVAREHVISVQGTPGDSGYFPSSFQMVIEGAGFNLQSNTGGSNLPSFDGSVEISRSNPSRQITCTPLDDAANTSTQVLVFCDGIDEADAGVYRVTVTQGADSVDAGEITLRLPLMNARLTIFRELTQDGIKLFVEDPIFSSSSATYRFDDFVWNIEVDAGTITDAGATKHFNLDARSFVVTGLDPGDSATVRLRFTNPDFLDGDDSVSFTVPVIPDPPAQPTVTAGDQTLTIGIPANSVMGPGPRPEFEATVTPGGATCTLVQEFPSGWDPTTDPLPDYECTILGLENGTSYTATVTATNVAGTSNPSQPSAAATPLPTQPDPAPQPTAVAGDGEATVTVVQAGTGGTPASYTVTADPGGATCTVSGASGSCTVTGLDNGTSYTFSAVATNLAGSSQPSVASAAVTPEPPPPGVPGTPTVVRGDGSATVTVTPPSSGGTPASYTVTADPGGATCSVSGASGSCTVTGLTNGTSYTFTVTANNANSTSGTSAASSPSAAVTPVALPGIPSGLAATHGDRQVALSWTPGSDGGSGALLGHLVEYSTDSGANWITAIADTGSPSGSATVTGLVNGTDYLFRVAGISSAGSGTALVQASPSTPSTTPAAVASLVAQAGDGEVTLSWTAGDDGGAQITGHRIEQNVGTGWTTLVADTGSSATTHTVTGLTNGTAYDFRVTPINSNGASAAAPQNLRSAVVPVEAPGIPERPVAVSGPGSATVTVAAGSGGAPATIAVTAAPGGKGCTITGSAGSCTVAGLTPGASYTFTAIATNATASSSTSIASVPVSPTPVPVSVTPPGVTPPAVTPPAVTPPAAASVSGSANSSSTNALPGGPGGRSPSALGGNDGVADSPRPVDPGDDEGSPRGGGTERSMSALVRPSSPVPVLLGTDALSTLTRRPGDAMMRVGDEEVAVTVQRVTAAHEVDGEGVLMVVAPEARTAAQVEAIQREGRELLLAIQAVTGDAETVPVSLRETPTGATLIGVAVQPSDGVTPLEVPVEDVIAILTDDSGVLVAGVNADDAPAAVTPAGALRIDPDGHVAVTAFGLPAGADGEVIVMSSPVVLGNFTVDANGGFSGQVQLPDGLRGEHTVVLAARDVSSSVGIEIVESDNVPDSVAVVQAALPQTAGSGTATATTAAVAVVLAASLILLASSRRRRGQAEESDRMRSIG